MWIQMNETWKTATKFHDGMNDEHNRKLYTPYTGASFSFIKPIKFHLRDRRTDGRTDSLPVPLLD